MKAELIKKIVAKRMAEGKCRPKCCAVTNH